MMSLLSLAKGLPLFAACVLGSAKYPPIPADLTTPVQQRLAINGPSSVSVAWNTYKALTKPCVQYGTSASALSLQSCSTSSVTYPTSRTWANVVTLANLAPATTYYYKIVSTNSTVEHFFSPRVAGDKKPFNMSVVIDLGVYGANGYTIASNKAKRDTIPFIQPSLNHTTIGRLASTVDSYEFVVHPGDIGYADDWILTPANLFDGKDGYQAITETFFDQLAPIAGRKPYMTSPGNHEASCQEIPSTSGLCPAGQKNFTDFINRFGATMPTAFTSTSTSDAARVNANKAALLANPPFWFSFEYGMAHVVMIDTETDFANAPDQPGGSAKLGAGPFGSYANEQLDFLAADLASVDRTVTPWVIVAGHRPWYSTGDEQCEPCRLAFEPLLYKYGVDLAIFGHVHNSQRFAPTYNKTADPAGMNNPKAPMYIVAGGAGNIEGLSAAGTAQSYNRFVYADQFSYATVNFLDAQNLQVNFIRSDNGALLDTSTLFKKHNQQFVVQ
ncbi:Metallo-dependent phosphatase-like protein [Podospora appendiculata]|uniref:Purple acid phosphatase n=1 Tax=Podospora appendiculata TaxID=314037 RepID=A0AAE0X3K2_9PEZI|nr:Metallo-dependent phosphatase-like protein [Podospora appendiculata]